MQKTRYKVVEETLTHHRKHHWEITPMTFSWWLPRKNVEMFPGHAGWGIGKPKLNHSWEALPLQRKGELLGTTYTSWAHTSPGEEASMGAGRADQCHWKATVWFLERSWQWRKVPDDFLEDKGRVIFKKRNMGVYGEVEAVRLIPVFQGRLQNKFCWSYPSYAWIGLQEKKVNGNS